MTETTRKAPDAAALFLRDVRRRIREIEKIAAQAETVGAGSALRSPQHWHDRAAALVNNAVNGDIEHDAAVEACAAMWLAIRRDAAT